MYTDYKLAYVSRLIYPDTAANALQTMKTAAALSLYAGDVFLFVHALTQPEAHIRQQYNITEAPLTIWPMNTPKLPHFINHRGALRVLAYNTAINLNFRFNRRWRGAAGARPVVFVRSRLEGLYWGLLRAYTGLLRDWVFVYELHDLALPIQDAQQVIYDANAKRTRRTVRALQHYDVLLAKTGQLASDVQNLTGGTVQPVVFPNGSALRVAHTPPININPAQGVLGYIGTVDLERGVDDVFAAVRLLPEGWRLRVVGRMLGAARTWLENQLQDSGLADRVEIKAQIGYAEVPAEIDSCDILLAPAGDTMLSNRYRSPLKIFDYMARGKPIIAADVPAHRELLQDGVHALLYRRGAPQHLAEQIKTLIHSPGLAQTLAAQAWLLSADYTYEARARQMLAHIDAAWHEKARRASRSQSR